MYQLMIRRLSNRPVQDHIHAADHILIVAPHPDDEVIGLAAIMMEALDQGGEVFVLFLTDGEASGADPDPERIRAKRVELRDQILASMGIPLSHIHALSLPDGSVPGKEDPAFEHASSRVLQIIRQIAPTKLYVTHPADYWPFDHVHAAEIVTAAWVTSGRSCELYYYWVWAWYNMRPSRWRQLNFNRLFKVDIEKHLKAKHLMIGAYLDPKAPSGTPWSGKLPSAMLAPHLNRYEILERVDV